jgi:biotin operon repressor
MAQKNKLLELLKDNNWHSNIEIFNELRIWRVSARIYDLKKDGYNIETRSNTQDEKQYLYFYRLKQN